MAILGHTKLGFVGLGSIGIKIAINLKKAGYCLCIHNRTRNKEKHPQLKGSISFPSPKKLARDVEILLICVTDDDAVEDVLFGEDGAFWGLPNKSIVVDFSTISPQKARSNSKRLAKKCIEYLDCPVSGGTEGAENGSLSIFVGGKKESFEDVKHLLSNVGSSIYYFGDSGKGQEVKAVNQILVAGTYVAVAEAISLGKRLELPMHNVINALNKGAASSWPLSNRSKSMISDNYPLGFKLGLHHKDLKIALKIAKDVGLKIPITTKVKEIEELMIEQGYNDYDVSSLHIGINKIINKE